MGITRKKKLKASNKNGYKCFPFINQSKIDGSFNNIIE